MSDKDRLSGIIALFPKRSIPAGKAVGKRGCSRSDNLISATFSCPVGTTWRGG